MGTDRDCREEDAASESVAPRENARERRKRFLRSVFVVAGQKDDVLAKTWTLIAGVAVRHLRLAPFEPSAPLKLKMALLWADRDLPK